LDGIIIKIRGENPLFFNKKIKKSIESVYIPLGVEFVRWKKAFLTPIIKV